MNRASIPGRAGIVRQMALGTLAVQSLPSTATPDTAEAWLAKAAAHLPPEEIALAATFALPRRLGFVGGRLALRTALAAIGEPVPPTFPPVLRTHRGAPALPSGLLGSISHKAHRAVALTRRATDMIGTIGVDLEAAPGEDDLARSDIAPRILTARERDTLHSLAAQDPLRYRTAVRLRFALKEAVYKAIDPYVERYVPFQQVEVFPTDDGTVEVRLLLPELARRSLIVRASWTTVQTDLVAMAVGWAPPDQGRPGQASAMPTRLPASSY